MALLEMREAAFVRGGKMLLAPTSLTVESGAYADVHCESAMAAGIIARLAAAIVRPTRGRVFVGEFEPRIQPVQVKRLVGFVPRERPWTPCNADSYFAYRAALWGIDPQEAGRRGRELLATLSGVPSGDALLLAGALLHAPQLLILECPGVRLREAAQNAAATSATAIFATYAAADEMR